MSRRGMSTMAGILAATATFGGVHTADAQSTAGSLQLGLATRIASHTKTSTTYRPPNLPSYVDRDESSTATQWGFGDRDNVSLEVGYGLGEHLVMGGLATIGGESKSHWDRLAGADQEESIFSLLVGPKLDYMLLPASPLRPFAGVVAGVDRSNVVTRGSRSSMTGMDLRGRVGVHCFAASGFSIEPAFFFEGRFLWGTFRENDNAHTIGYTFGLSVGASGWIGL